MGNRHKWAEENKGEKRKRGNARKQNSSDCDNSKRREGKETDNNPGSCVRSVSGLMKIYMKKGGRDRHHLHEETKTGRTRYLHEVIFLFMPLFCSLCSRSAIRFCSNALGETRKHVSKTGVTPATSSSPPRPPSAIAPERDRNKSRQPISGGRVRKAPESPPPKHAVRPCIDAMMYDGCW